MRDLNPRTPTRKVRHAFTLIELLVVIAIIGILAAIVLAAVSRTLGTGPELQTTNDLRQFAIGLEQFKGKYGVYPPSKITLCSDLTVLAKVDPVSLGYLTSMWSHLGQNLGANEALDWAGTGLQRQYSQNRIHPGGRSVPGVFPGGHPGPQCAGRHGFFLESRQPDEHRYGRKAQFLSV